MRTLKTGRYEEYSNEIDKENIGGSLKKNFIRIDSEFITNYFDEICKPNCSYQSYADDLIKECYDPLFRNAEGKRELPLKYFSVLIKETEGHYVYNGELNEVIGSRISNLFQIPTVYNKKISYNGEPAIISLDFVKKNEEIVSMLDLYALKNPNESVDAIDNEFGETQTMSNWVDLIMELLYFYISPDADNRDKMIDDICGDFCVQMFFKILILCDEDFSLKNISALISTDKKSARLSPAYDFEYCRFNSYSLEIYFLKAISYLKYMKEHYPEKLATFMDNFNKATHYKNGEINGSHIHRIIADNYKQNYLVNDYLKKFMENIHRIDFIYDKFMSGELETMIDDANMDIKTIKQEYLHQLAERSLN